MRPILIVLIAVALGVAALTAFLLIQFVGSQPTKQEQVAVGTTDVLVVARDLGPGAVLTDADLRWEKWPMAVVDPRFIVKPEGGADNRSEYIGQMARRSIMAGEPVSAPTLIKQGEAGIASANLAPGMRSVTIQVGPQTGAAGLILPGDRVDVILLSNVRDNSGLDAAVGRETVARFGAEVLLRNVRVVAVNQLMKHNPADGPGVNAQTVTLEVTPAQAQQLALVAMLGTISLSLRSWAKDDTDKKADEQAPLFVTDRDASRLLDDLMKGGSRDSMFSMPVDDSEAGTAPLADDSSSGGISSVRINRGGAVSVETFGF
jgi:pilus assembly protein CpaB